MRNKRAKQLRIYSKEKNLDYRGLKKFWNKLSVTNRKELL